MIGSDDDDDDDDDESVERQPKFRRNISYPSSGADNKSNKKAA
jgi:hypothetical protein